MKTKIVFAGVMGAILMSVGANAATTLATKGYVDQLVGNTVTSMDAKYVTMKQVADAIGAGLADGKIDLSAYQLTDNIVTEALANVVGDDKNTKYPSVGAVLDAIDAKISALNLSPEQIESLKGLLGSEGVVASINKLENDVNTLKTDVATLNGEGEGSVAKSIADAISTHTIAADAKYQAQSTADLQIGTTGGKFRDMTVAEKAALASGVTAEKVTAYDALTGDTGTVAELQKAIDGLNGEDGTITTINTTVTELQTVVGDENSGLVKDVAANKTAIAANTAAIANKITMPAACASGNQTCVLMVANGIVSWTPVTSPVEDPVTGGTTGE